ncbi:MAG: type IV secretory system conjugative DNA transfer family protein [Polyangiales bacterium]
MSFANWLRSVVADDTREAFAVVDRAAARSRREAEAPQRRARDEMEQLAGRPRDTVALGASLGLDGNPFTVRIREAEMRRGHWFVTGATGSGKSFWAVSALLQMLRRRPAGWVVIDLKGELAKDLREVWIPSLVASLPDDQARNLIRRVAVIAPFDETSVAPFQLLARDPSLSIELQAREVASSFGHTIGRDLGALQTTILNYALMLAIDVGLTLPDLPKLLSDPEILRAAVARSTMPEVQSYFATRFPREKSGSLISLLSRLDTLLMHVHLRKMLSAPGMIRFDRLIEDAVTIIDLGRAPAGIRELSRFFGSILFQKIVRAVFARRIDDDTPPVTIVADEFQSLLSKEVAADFDAILTQARSQRAFLWMLCQQVAQVQAVSGTLLDIIQTNSSCELLFRANVNDARALDHIFPIVKNIPRDRVGSADPRVARPMMSEAEERRQIVESVPQMPDRVAWYWNQRRPYRALLMRSPDVNREGAVRLAATLPAAVREALARGVLATPTASTDDRPAPAATAARQPLTPDSDAPPASTPSVRADSDETLANDDGGADTETVGDESAREQLATTSPAPRSRRRRPRTPHLG